MNIEKIGAQRDERPEALTLFRNLKTNAVSLEQLLKKCNDERADGVYRFYHQSFKVYYLQHLTSEIIIALRSLAPDRPLNKWLMHIVADGTGKTFSMDDNARWLEATRPIVEAFFHAMYFLEMAVNSSRELTEPPVLIPSGWAAVLSLYDLR